jgi:hypothetical protein
MMVAAATIAAAATQIVAAVTQIAIVGQLLRMTSLAAMQPSYASADLGLASPAAGTTAKRAMSQRMLGIF